MFLFDVIDLKNLLVFFFNQTKDKTKRKSERGLDNHI